MQKNRREFLKKLMVGTSVGLASTSVLAKDKAKKTEKGEEILYSRNKTWEFYYKQSN
ncbi:putative formate dehydrogenase-associated protein [Campylobacter pinnipediorum subsp. caledonicus]|uniref:Putative formate dehydrogenase-associated protein n=1 Tax=Campylobacter pinnipediorum subsp. caledonicus TaxID=1874362 RepID=A0A1S6U914_9BACT|nr:Tat pathway signal protein [Campylobacter pinnipediorum]AQW86273.1 putative formate dehydrogenase-associated protein [Campylobacter pinnipediorum subsp. caledonicus]AQW87927.1 putative formate dehydrogenase-associated protein [Campylobacter pinnipediorum subsp. caledonicus]